MRTDGADLGSFGAEMDVSAVAAFPCHDAVLFEDLAFFDCCGKAEISLLVLFLDCRDSAHFFRDFGKSFRVGFVRHPVVHIRPLGVFARGGVDEVFQSVAYAVKFLEPEFGVFLFVVRSFGEKCRNLLVAVFFALLA